MRRATLDETLDRHPIRFRIRCRTLTTHGLEIAGGRVGARHVTRTGGAGEMPSTCTVVHAVSDRREYYGRRCAARPWKLPIPRLQPSWASLAILPAVQVQVDRFSVPQQRTHVQPAPAGFTTT